MTDDDDGEVMVPLAEEVRVRRRFQVGLGSPSTGPMTRHFNFDIVMVDGRPHVMSVTVTTIDESSPISPAELADVDLVAWLDTAVAVEVYRHRTPMRYSLEQVQDGTWSADARTFHASAVEGVRKARHRRIGPELLAQVVALYDKGGISEVMAELHYSERHARRLLAEAKKLGLR